MLEHETKKKIDAAIRSEEDRLKDRGYKYLAIANPNNGEEFFKVLYGLKWDEPGMLKITRDKLYCLASSKIPSDRLLFTMMFYFQYNFWYFLVFAYYMSILQKEGSFATHEFD